MIKNKRTQWLINKNFQLRFSLYSLAPMMIAVLLFWISVEIFFYKMILLGQKYNLPAGHGYYQLISAQKSELHLIIIITTIILSVVFFIWSIFISHRIAGPFFKMKRYLDNAKSLEEVTQGELFFRKKDFFQEIPEAFNQFIKRISKKQ